VTYVHIREASTERFMAIGPDKKRRTIKMIPVDTYRTKPSYFIRATMGNWSCRFDPIDLD
jgi:hypothetical protein